MLELFRKLHADGVPTGLLSNSWGGSYPHELFPDMFDAVVISSEVGMRKPEPRIFLHAAQLLGLAPQECIFIDDIEANITAAEEIGFTGVLHNAADHTAERVAELLGFFAWLTTHIRLVRAVRRTCGPTGAAIPSRSSRCGAPCTSRGTGIARTSGST